MMFELTLLLLAWHAAIVLLGVWYSAWRYTGTSLTLQSLPRGGVYSTISEPIWQREGKREGYFVMIAPPQGGVRLLYCGYYALPPRWTIRGLLWRTWEAVPHPPSSVVS